MDKRKAISIALAILIPIAIIALIVAVIAIYFHVYGTEAHWSWNAFIFKAVALIVGGFLMETVGLILRKLSKKKCIFGIVLGVVGLAFIAVGCFTIMLPFAGAVLLFAIEKLMMSEESYPFLLAFLGSMAALFLIQIGVLLFLINKNRGLAKLMR